MFLEGLSIEVKGIKERRLFCPLNYQDGYSSRQELDERRVDYPLIWLVVNNSINQWEKTNSLGSLKILI